jgi:cell fate regulator YaaT (PSP1 superfamily)
MTNVISVIFKKGGKAYYFAPGKLSIKEGDFVIVDTARGTECGTVVQSAHFVEDSALVTPLKEVLRIRDAADISRLTQNKMDEKKAFDICLEKIEKTKLVMKLVDVEYTFDRNKILFYYTADGRVDFRDLVKELASVFHTRIEMRQIGARDESKMIGGIGLCGQTLCCARFMNDFVPVGIKMAKEQGLSLNPSKINGVCGRLMCCLSYEQNVYDYLKTVTPAPGSSVKTADGIGTVESVANLLSGTLKVRLDDNKNGMPTVYKVSEVKVINNRKSES